MSCENCISIYVCGVDINFLAVFRWCVSVADYCIPTVFELEW